MSLEFRKSNIRKLYAVYDGNIHIGQISVANIEWVGFYCWVKDSLSSSKIKQIFEFMDNIEKTGITGFEGDKYAW